MVGDFAICWSLFCSIVCWNNEFTVVEKVDSFKHMSIYIQETSTECIGARF